MKSCIRLCLGIAMISLTTGCYCYGPYCPLLGWNWGGAGGGCPGGNCGMQPGYGAPAYGAPMMGPQGYIQPYDASMSAGVPMAPQTSYAAPTYTYSYPATAAAPLESLPTY
ncbi:MAG: hypothetical protein ACKVT0_17645 [Planctomycetaceae bacterium]